MRRPYALWLADGSKRYEIRTQRHNRSGERIAICATQPREIVGLVTLGSIRDFSAFDDEPRVRDIAKEARTTVEHLRKYQAQRAHLYAWEVLDPLQIAVSETDTADLVDRNAQTWVRLNYSPPKFITPVERFKEETYSFFASYGRSLKGVEY